MREPWCPVTIFTVILWRCPVANGKARKGDFYISKTTGPGRRMMVIVAMLIPLFDIRLEVRRRARCRLL
jgi:hypothetical protein